jgi:hypothetical protein
VNDRDIDDVLNRAAGSSPQVDPALVDRISQSIGGTLRPVRPLPSLTVLAAAMMSICTAAALLAGTVLGMHGIQKMGAAASAFVFFALAIFMWIAALASCAQIIPGSRRYVAPWILLVVICLGMDAVFVWQFDGLVTEQFVAQGIPCLATGLSIAIAVAAGCWSVLRRGLAVTPVTAGVAVGALAGLSGLAALELHCPNLEIAHVLVWHTAIPLLGGVLGAVIGLLAAARHSRSPD